MKSLCLRQPLNTFQILKFTLTSILCVGIFEIGTFAFGVESESPSESLTQGQNQSQDSNDNMNPWPDIELNRNVLPIMPPRAKQILDNSQHIQTVHNYGYGDFANQNAPREAIRNLFNLESTQNVIIGNGSDEFIDRLPDILAPKGGTVVMPASSYIGHEESVKKQILLGRKYRIALSDLNPDFSYSTDSILKTVRKYKSTRYVIIANPANPTGFALSLKEIEKLATELKIRNIYLVVDGAYSEFVSPDNPEGIPTSFDLVDLTKKFDNVLYLGTLSKAMGMASAGLGYFIGNNDRIKLYESIRQDTSVRALGQRLVQEVMTKDAYLGWVDFIRKLVAKEKGTFYHFLSGLKISYLPSEGSFVMIHLGSQSKEFVSYLKSRKIAVLDLSTGYPQFEGWVRISIGLSWQMVNLKIVMKAWRDRNPLQSSDSIVRETDGPDSGGGSKKFVCSKLFH